MSEDQKDHTALVMSFYAVRQSLGALGLALPVGLLAYGLGSGNGIEPSISEFYYTTMGDVLVGTLAAIGVFLFAYKGYARRSGEWVSDKWVARTAGASAIGVALLPARPPVPCTGTGCLETGLSRHPEALHYASAVVFFACLAVFSLVLFTRTGDSGQLSARKRRSNKIYRICGWLILAALAALIALVLAGRFAGPAANDLIQRNDLIFWVEALGVWAFGISWLVKGRAMRFLTG